MIQSVPAVPDLDSRTEIHDFVVAFYRAIVFDDVLERVFDEIAEVDWALHIPKLVDYWCKVLLGDPSYVGAMFAAHEHLHGVEPLRPEWFERWHELFVETLEAGWAGPGADHAVEHAERQLAILHRRLLGGELARGGT